MAKIRNTDPFICIEPVEISPGISRILKQRMKTADEGRLVCAKEARRRIQQLVSKFSTIRDR